MPNRHKTFMIIGNIGFELMHSYLRSLGIKSVLVMTTKEPINGSLADKAFFYRDKEDFFPLMDIALKNNVDAVISISGPDKANIRDAYLRRYLEPMGITVVANPLESVKIAADKIKTKVFLRRNGFPFVEGEEVYSAEQAIETAKKLGFPVAIKSANESGGQGFMLARNRPQLEEILDGRDDYPVLMEEYAQGHEFSVEVLSSGGKTFVLNPVYKGYTMSCGVHPMERIKISPPPVSKKISEKLMDTAERIIGILGLEPTGDVDFVWTENGLKVFEINPRFGGVTAISMASSRVEVYKAIVDMALGIWQPEKMSLGKALCVDIPIADDLNHSQISRIFRQNDFVFRVKKQTLKKSRGRITVTGDSTAEILSCAEEIATKYHAVFGVEEIKKQILQDLKLA